MNNNIYVGGQVIDQWGTFKRNKRDIIKQFTRDGHEYNLNCILEGYYNKALIYKDYNNSCHDILISYNTIVAERDGDKFIIYGYYSKTTANHINAFLNYCNYNLNYFSKKDIEQNQNKWLNIKDFLRK